MRESELIATHTDGDTCISVSLMTSLGLNAKQSLFDN